MNLVKIKHFTIKHFILSLLKLWLYLYFQVPLNNSLITTEYEQECTGSGSKVEST